MPMDVLQGIGEYPSAFDITYANNGMAHLVTLPGSIIESDCYLRTWYS